MTLYWAVLLLAIATSIGGQVLLKSGAGEADFITQLFAPHTIIGLVLYGGAAMFYIVALRRIPMSVALPCTAISYVAVAFLGNSVFGETISLAHMGAIALICTGVLLLAFTA